MTFTFIHAADIHLDSPLRGLSRYESAPAEAIRNACRRALENLVDLAIEQKVAFLLLAGDLFDGDWKDYSTGIFLSRQMGRLARHDISVYAVAGNHDAANRMTKALDTAANMTMLSSRKVETVILDALGVAIHGRSFPTQHVAENLAADYPGAERGMFNIGLLHTSLDGREGHAAYAPCTVDDLCSRGYDYWALGHVHQQEFVSRDPWIVFPGCIQGRHIRETGAKGCVLVTVEDGAVNDVECVPLDVMRWAALGVDVADAEDMSAVRERTRNTLETEYELAGGRPLAIRVRFEGASVIADTFAAYPERFEHEIKALGAEVAGDDVWIERVENGTTGRRDLAAMASENTAIGQLLGEILATPSDPDEIHGLSALVGDLRQKLPSAAFGDGSALNLDERDTIERLVEEAKQMLVGRLLTTGDGK